MKSLAICRWLLGRAGAPDGAFAFRSLSTADSRSLLDTRVQELSELSVWPDCRSLDSWLVEMPKSCAVSVKGSRLPALLCLLAVELAVIQVRSDPLMLMADSTYPWTLSRVTVLVFGRYGGKKNAWPGNSHQALMLFSAFARAARCYLRRKIDVEGLPLLHTVRGVAGAGSRVRNRRHAGPRARVRPRDRERQLPRGRRRVLMHSQKSQGTLSGLCANHHDALTRSV